METASPVAAPAESSAPAPASPTFRLTEKAVLQVREVMKAQGFDDYVLTVRVVPAGCSGFGYDLNLFKDAKPTDLQWEQEGIRVSTDALSAKYLLGTEVDYVVGDHSAGFKFNNPQAKQSCGCGSSFST